MLTTPYYTIKLNFLTAIFEICYEKKINLLKRLNIFREWLDPVERTSPPASITGTTAEIFEFYEPPPESLQVGLRIKARGRQRFKVLSSRSQIDG